GRDRLRKKETVSLGPPCSAGRERGDWSSALPGPARRAVPRLPALLSRPGIAGPDLTETASLPGATIGGTGQFQGNGVRITDSQNGPSGQDPGTLHDIGFPIPIACIPTTDTTVGSNCGVNTTVNALAPGVNVDGNA